MKNIISLVFTLLYGTTLLANNTVSTYTYKAHDGNTYNLHTLEGEYIYFSYNQNDTDYNFNDKMFEGEVMDAFNKAILLYRKLGQVEHYPPKDYVTHFAFPAGKGSVAIVPILPCGSNNPHYATGCGLQAKAELQKRPILTQLNRGKQRDPSKATFWWIGLYELGRGTHFPIKEGLTYDGNNEIIGSAFPHLVANVALREIGYTDKQLKKQMDNSIAGFKEKYKIEIGYGSHFVDWFPLNGRCVKIHHGQTLGCNQYNGIPSMDVMATIFYEFYSRHGVEKLEDFFEVINKIKGHPKTPLELSCRISNAMDKVLNNESYDISENKYLVDHFAFPACNPIQKNPVQMQKSESTSIDDINLTRESLEETRKADEAFAKAVLEMGEEAK